MLPLWTLSKVSSFKLVGVPYLWGWNNSSITIQFFLGLLALCFAFGCCMYTNCLFHSWGHFPPFRRSHFRHTAQHTPTPGKEGERGGVEDQRNNKGGYHGRKKEGSGIRKYNIRILTFLNVWRLQRSKKWLVHGLVKFATAEARQVCPDLLG